MKNKTVMTVFLLTCFVLVCAISQQDHASAQTTGDTKVLSGSAGQLISCNFLINGGSVPQIATIPQYNNLDLFLLSQNTEGSTSNCVVRWPIERDHPTGSPPSVTVHFFKRATSANYGRIACQEIVTQHSVQGGDSSMDIAGSWNQTNDNPSDPNGVPLSMVLQPPTFVSYLNGHTPTWSHGAASVLCDFGNDYVVTDVEWTESGAD